MENNRMKCLYGFYTCSFIGQVDFCNTCDEGQNYQMEETKNDYNDLNDLCKQHCKEGVTGAISFTKGFYTKLCNHLGIKYSNLSRTGKAALKAHAIDTVNMRWGDNFNDGFYYEKF